MEIHVLCQFWNAILYKEKKIAINLKIVGYVFRSIV